MARISTPDSDDQTNQSLIMRPIKAQAYVLPKHILSVWKRCGDRKVLFFCFIFSRLLLPLLLSTWVHIWIRLRSLRGRKVISGKFPQSIMFLLLLTFSGAMYVLSWYFDENWILGMSLSTDHAVFFNIVLNAFEPPLRFEHLVDFFCRTGRHVPLL